jgi:hypothetical protein
MDPATVAIASAVLKQLAPLIIDELRKTGEKDAKRVYTEFEIQIALDRAMLRLQNEGATRP